MNNYDVIVIGAGNGGLASAATLAKNGKKVLLLEKHNIPGGCGTSFCRGRFEFEVALHQLSGMGTSENPGPMRSIFMELGIEDQINWFGMDNLYRVVLPGHVDVTLPANMEEAIATLSQRFPEEKEQIRKFYELVYDLFTECFRIMGSAEARVKPEKFPLYFEYGLKNSQEVMDQFFTNKELQLCLNVYWTFMGMPPVRLPFTVLAANIFNYIEFKPSYLKGGSQVISNALTEVILNSGSDVRLNCEVKRIIVKDDKAVGVITGNGDEMYAEYIISNISPIHTYVNLLPADQVPQSAIEYLSSYKVGISALTCFIGLDCPPEEIGIKESMNLFYTSDDVNEAFACSHNLMVEDDPIVFTCYTIDDPTVCPEGTSLITMGCMKYGQPWIELSPEMYHETKYKCAAAIVERIEKQYPGFSEHIEEFEVATPLTHMRYLNHPGGAIYGFEQDINSTGVFYPNESQIKNLIFAGGWVGLCGFGPNYTLGYLTANGLLSNFSKEGN